MENIHSHRKCFLRTDGLADRVRVVGDLEVRQVLADLLGHLFRGEAHGSDVVCAQGQLAFWSLHELHRGTVAVTDMHHGKTGVWAQVALMVTRAEGIVEDLDCIVYRRGELESLEAIMFGGPVSFLKIGFTLFAKYKSRPILNN